MQPKQQATRIGLIAVVVLALTGCAGAQSSAPPVPTGADLTEADRLNLAAETLDQYKEHLESTFPGIELPEVDVVRFVDPFDGMAVQAQCISEQGFPAEATVDNGIVFGEIPDEQAEAQSVAVYTCRAKYPVDPMYTQPLNDSQVAYLYYYSGHELTDCVTDAGYTVPDLPSMTVFAQGVAGESEEWWNPYENVVGEVGSYEELMSVVGNCPQYPEALWSSGQ